MERSRYNPLAPRLTERERGAMLADDTFAPNYLLAFERMLTFYGFGQSDRGLCRLPLFDSRAQVWLTPGNHNYLRLTRIQKSLRLFGYEDESRRLFRALQGLCDDGYAEVIGEKSIGFWRQAQEE